MNFKYQNDYHKLLPEVCPPADYEPFNNACLAYRWFFQTIENPANFISQYHKKPKRYLNATDIDKCEAMALSMFNSAENAKNRFNTLKNTIGQQVYKTLGCNIAEGLIDEKDGVNGKCNTIGHFNHHQSLEADYSTKFKIIDEL